jgi:hypothetical protein
MDGFTKFLIEDNNEEIPMKDLHVIILGLGDEEGTFADHMQELMSKYGMKSTMVDVAEAFIASKDVEVGEVTIHNINGKDKEVSLKVKNSLVFVKYYCT